jgi:hypothetical protein
LVVEVDGDPFVWGRDRGIFGNAVFPHGGRRVEIGVRGRGDDKTLAGAEGSVVGESVELARAAL